MKSSCPQENSQNTDSDTTSVTYQSKTPLTEEKTNYHIDKFTLTHHSDLSDREEAEVETVFNHNHSVNIYVTRGIEADSKLPFMTLRTPQGITLLALVDSGATSSIISSRAAEKLKLKLVGQRKLKFSGFISESQEDNCNFYRLDVLDNEGRNWAATLASYRNMNITFVKPNLKTSEVASLRKQHVDEAQLQKLQQYDGQPIDIILGNNVLGNMGQQMITLPSGRMVTRTKLGIIIYPPMEKNVLVPTSTHKPIVVSDSLEHIAVHTIDTPDYGKPLPQSTNGLNISNQKLDKQVEQHWSLEMMGIEPPEVVSHKARLNIELIEKFKKSSIRDETNKIHVEFPFNGREEHLPDNFAIAKRRLESLLKSQTADTKKKYDDIIQQQLSSGIIEKVTEDMESVGPFYYIPHRCIVKEDSTNTKLRIVLDASSHAKGKPSLNDCIHPGPSILQNIMGIMIRYRLRKFLMISDIEKAFHQVRIQPKHRNATRFIWLKDITKGATPDNIVIFRFTRLPFGVTCSPFLLAVTLLRYLELDPNPLNARIIENLYVDNVLITTNDEKELLTLYPKLKSIFQKMHMNLREFLCNSQGVMETIKEEDKILTPVYKLLGHMWDSSKDVITIKIAVPPSGIPTKREIIAFLARNYDPTGIISPIVVQIKKFITMLWEYELKWNDKIPEPLIPRWTDIVSQFTATVYTVPRQLVTSYDYTGIQLVLFSDASMDHYAVAAYIRYEYPDNSFQARLIFAKSRIKPGRTGMTIPQLELLALQTATNAAITLQEELHLEIKRVRFFSDSTCVLYWVLHKISSHIGLRWAANRVATIHENIRKLTELQLHPEIRYVPTSINPADIASRGCSVDELQKNELWHNGPPFLSTPEEEWPKNVEVAPNDPKEFNVFLIQQQHDAPQEDKRKQPEEVHHNKAEIENHTYHIAVNEDKFESIVPYSRTNSLGKLVTITNFALNFVHQCMEKRNTRFPNNKYEYKSKSLAEYKQAVECKAEPIGLSSEIEKRRITRLFIFRDHYVDSEHRLNLKPHTALKPIQCEDGLVRHQRPFANSKHKRHTDEMKRPVIIIHKHPLAQLLVIESHVSLLHQGVKDVIVDLQQRFWIPKIGILVRKVRAECITCRKIHARPFAYPYSETLPAVRSELVAPFKFVGLDYFGPLRYKTKEDSNKVWVLLVTCIVTRAVHLEVVPDNTTFSFILALKRYFGRRGVPKSILSDNAPAFKLGYSMVNMDLKTVIHKSHTLTSFLADREIEIHFITPLSPWKGGIYERIVALVKNLINKVLGKITIPFLELESLLIEAESIINSRPITANKMDIADATPIRPIDYLIPQAKIAVPESEHTIVGAIKAGDTQRLTRKLLDSTKAVRKNLWNIFSEEYYVLLRECTIPKTAHSKDQPIPGTLVLVEKGKYPRYTWPIGVIQQIIVSEDGEVRSVKVKLGTKILEKSVNHLIPLELPIEDTEHASESNKSSEPMKSSNESSPQPQGTNIRTRPYLHRKAKDNKITAGHPKP